MEEKQRLQNCLLRGRPILFTGAGFSKGGINGFKQPIPDGTALKKGLINQLLLIDEKDDDYSELISSSLSDLCTYCERETNPKKVKDYLSSQFSECSAQPYHKVIASFPWKKIYTTNIDDLFENAAPHGKLTVQNEPRQKSFTTAKTIEYLKLHGCVRNPSERFVFSRQDYIDSMMFSQDYRFSSFAQDIQTENIIFVGFNMDEINFEYYLNLYGVVNGQTKNGQLFFINPKPSRMFTSRINALGGHVIQWTTEEFADFLKKTVSIPKTEDQNYYLDGFLYVNKIYETKKAFKGYDSHLYFGNVPEWRDVIFDWDFINPTIDDIYSNIISYMSNPHNSHLVVSLEGKSLSGKSVYLKRLGLKFIKEDYCVYDFVGRRFDSYSFIKHCSKLEDNHFVLLIDNASFFYMTINSLVKKFPTNKSLLILLTSRPYLHNRKRYNLVSLDNYIEVSLDNKQNPNQRLIFAKNIANRLDEKGLLGSLKAKNTDERVSEIIRIDDVSTLLYQITRGQSFRDRQIESYNGIVQNKKGYRYDFLLLLAIFQKMDLPYLPLELLSTWNTDKYNEILTSCTDVIKKVTDNNGVMLRNNILTNLIFSKADYHKIMSLIRDILVIVSPQVSETVHSYWNEIQSTLMKGKMLRHKLKLKNRTVKNLLFDIKPYYNDDFNYWLQVGLAEQIDKDYEKALNHFRQAESLSYDSYLVQNAIARNYLRHANSCKNRDEADPLFAEGKKLMFNLINERDEYQVKAFSTHSFIFEQITFWKHFDLTPSVNEITQIFDMLKNILKIDPNDSMAKNVNNMFVHFLKSRDLLKKLPKMQLYDLNYLKGLFDDTDDNIQQLLTDYEIDS